MKLFRQGVHSSAFGHFAWEKRRGSVCGGGRVVARAQFDHEVGNYTPGGWEGFSPACGLSYPGEL